MHAQKKGKSFVSFVIVAFHARFKFPARLKRVLPITEKERDKSKKLRKIKEQRPVQLHWKAAKLHEPVPRLQNLALRGKQRCLRSSLTVRFIFAFFIYTTSKFIPADLFLFPFPFFFLPHSVNNKNGENALRSSGYFISILCPHR